MENEPISVESTTDKPATTPVRESSAANGLLMGGSALVVLGILVFITSSWQELTKPVRIFVVLLPFIFLNVLGFATRKRAHLKRLSDLTVFTGSIILPFILGFIFVQTSLFSWTTLSDRSLVIFLTTLISVLWYLVLEFAYSMYRHAILTVIAGSVMGWSFASFTEGPAYYYSLLGILFAYLCLSLGWLFDHSDDGNHAWQAQVYNTGGVILGWLGLMSLPYALADQLAKSGVIANSGFVVETTLMYVVVAVLFFLIAAPYGLDWLKRKSDNSLVIRQVAEQSAAISLTIPAILAVFNTTTSDSTAYLNTILLLVCGIIALTASYSVKVQSFRVLGLVSMVVVFSSFIINALTLIALNFILTIIILGLAMIILAFFFSHIQYRKIWTRLWQFPEDSAFGLGLYPERQSVARMTTNGHAVDDSIPRPNADKWLNATRGNVAPHQSNGWMILLWIIAGIFIFLLVKQYFSVRSSYYNMDYCNDTSCYNSNY
jgi:hypothetical protein